MSNSTCQCFFLRVYDSGTDGGVAVSPSRPGQAAVKVRRARSLAVCQFVKLVVRVRGDGQGDRDFSQTVGPMRRRILSYKYDIALTGKRCHCSASKQPVNPSDFSCIFSVSGAPVTRVSYDVF